MPPGDCAQQERKDEVGKQLDEFMAETKELQEEFMQAQANMQARISHLTAELEDLQRRFDGRESRKVSVIQTMVEHMHVPM